MRLRLVRPALRYFSSFVVNVRAPHVHALEYLAQAERQEGEREYWLVDGVHYYGGALIRSQAKGRKVSLATHIDVTSTHLSTEPTLIRLAVRKAWKFGIDPVRMSCDATDYSRRESIERLGGKLVDAVRERVPAHSGKVRMYSFSAPLLSLPPQGVLRDAGELGEDLARGSVAQPLSRPAV